jgi:hypothetical protein
MKFGIWVVFENLSRIFKFHYNLTTITVLYMKTYVHLWQYLAQFSLEWEMFQIKVVEKIKTHILCSITFFRKSCRLWDSVEKYGTARQATCDNIIRRMRFACRITKATYTHSGNVIVIAFPQHHWLRERASILCYTYIACLVCLEIHINKITPNDINSSSIVWEF